MAWCQSSLAQHSVRYSPSTSRASEALRRLRQTGVQIALATGLSRATVSRILRRLKLNRMRDLEPAPPTLRYEHAAPGDLLHLDIKKIGRFGAVGIRFRGDHKRKVKNMGWEYLHVAVDDHSQIAFLQILPNQKASTAAAFLRAAVTDYARLGIKIRRVLTDNGPCYRSASSAAVAATSASNRASPAPTHPTPTAKPNALSRPLCANGPTPRPMRTPHKGPKNYRTESTATTTIARMLALTSLRQSAHPARSKTEQRVETPHLDAKIATYGRNQEAALSIPYP